MSERGSSFEPSRKICEPPPAHQTRFSRRTPNTLRQPAPASRPSSRRTPARSTTTKSRCGRAGDVRVPDPAAQSESGHRANDWNVDKWLWSGRLRVVSCGALLKVILEDATSGELFATCPCKDPHSKAVDPVVDSSRYFVLRIESGDGKHAFIGMGFRDRNKSYDFNATLQDHWRSVEREKEAAELEAKVARSR